MGYVKDNKNLLTYNQWSAGEYENSPDIFVVKYYIKNINTPEYSDIGELSIKLTRTENGGTGGSYGQISYENSIPNKTLTASATIKTKETEVDMILLDKLSTQEFKAKYVRVPTNFCGNVNVSLESNELNSSFAIQFNNRGNKNDFLYVDNTSLIIS